MQYIEPVGAQGPANDFGHDYVDKNAGLGIAGSFLAADVPEHVQIELLNAIVAAGLTPAGANLKQLAQAIQSGKSTYVVATGTANAWTVAPNLAVPAYAAGRVLNIIAPATNTSTSVTVDVSTLGGRPLKKSDGSDPQVGDLVSGRVYATIDDGTNIRVLTMLPSDRLAQPYLGFHGDPVSLAIPNNVQTLVSSYTGIINNLPGATQSGGVIVIGTTGFYQVTANMASLLADYPVAYGASISVSIVNGSNAPIQSIASTPIEVTASSLTSSRAAAASGIAKLAAGTRIAAFFAQNKGASQNVSISLDAEFRGS